ncbi:type II/IV secretion system protein [Candidatus Saccharibacteria bacterium]|nr:type II/IV secretion system protein [Candidatus Saccharibacteria bacterium]
MAMDAREQEELMTSQRSEMLGSEYADARTFDVGEIPRNILSFEQMRAYKIIPVKVDGPRMFFAHTIETQKSTIEKVTENIKDHMVQFLVISRSGFNEVMERVDPPTIKPDPNVVVIDSGESASYDEVSRTLSEQQPRRIFNFLIKQAYMLGSSDIHIEPQKYNVRIRFRIDGTLHPIAEMDHEQYRHAMADVAAKSGISNNARSPQSGRANQDFQDENGDIKSINLRVETIPTIYGQDVVVRIFNLDLSLLNLDSLGFTDKEHEIVDDIVDHPHGLVMVVGPTGSGKSTTLFSIINKLNSPTRKIITLEDPVEYEISGITQVPVYTDDNDSFADKLRAVMREDPDVIMVGEIRDLDTAKAALQAALTGHLVLSTFHATDASTAISRLMDMIGHNPLLASAIRLIMAQRLVRKIAPENVEDYEPSMKIKEMVTAEISALKDPLYNPKNMKYVRPKKDIKIPYSGRMMLLEQLQMTDELEHLLGGPTAEVTSQAIKKLAVSQGMQTMLQDGIKKAYDGETTLEEIFRVI